MIYNKSYCHVVCLNTHFSLSLKGLIMGAPMDALREHDIHSPVLELWWGT